MKFFKKYFQLVGNNIRYLVVLVIFLVSAFYNLVIAPIENAEESEQLSSYIVENKQKPDLDNAISTKQYDGVLHSQAGDWYRLQLVARALDSDEALHVYVSSFLGGEKEVGKIDVKKSDQEKHFELVFPTDDVYEDIIIKKENNSPQEGWHDGGVILPYIAVSRLSITNKWNAQSLRPTLFGNTKSKKIALPQLSDQDLSSVSSSSKSHFMVGSIFEFSGDYMLGVEMDLQSNVSVADGKYRLELHDFDPVSRTISNDVLIKESFSLQGLEKRLNNQGNYYFDLPLFLEHGKQYFMGISDDKIKSVNESVQLNEIFSDTSSESGYFILDVAEFTRTEEGERLLTNSRIEDLGTFMKYDYQLNHAALDLMDIVGSSGKVFFDNENKLVVGERKQGTSYTYKIHTFLPFSVLRMEARQHGDTKDQVRIEYSYDNVSWNEVQFQQAKGESQEFNVRLKNNSQNISDVYFRVSYAGSDKKNDTFGLDMFRVEANMLK